MPGDRAGAPQPPDGEQIVIGTLARRRIRATTHQDAARQRGEDRADALLGFVLVIVSLAALVARLLAHVIGG